MRIFLSNFSGAYDLFELQTISSGILFMPGEKIDFSAQVKVPGSAFMIC